MQYLPEILRGMTFCMCEDVLRTAIMQPYESVVKGDYVAVKPLSWLADNAANPIYVDCALFVQIVARAQGHWKIPAFMVGKVTFLLFAPEHAAHYAHLQPVNEAAYAALGPYVNKGQWLWRPSLDEDLYVGLTDKGVAAHDAATWKMRYISSLLLEAMKKNYTGPLSEYKELQTPEGWKIVDMQTMQKAMQATLGL